MGVHIDGRVVPVPKRDMRATGSRLADCCEP